MDRDDKSRRGQKRPAPSVELPTGQDDDQQPFGVEIEVSDFAGAQPQTFSASDLTCASDFPGQSRDFGTKTFLSGEFQALGFQEPVVADIQTLAGSSKVFSSMSSQFDATTSPSTSHGNLLFLSEIKQPPTDISTQCFESNIRDTSTIQSENLLACEQFSSNVTLAEHGLSQDSFHTLKDAHDTFSELFPSYSSFLSEGFSGIGTEGSHNVEHIGETFGCAPGISFKPAYFEQPEEDPADDQPTESTSSNVSGSDLIYPGSRMSVHESVMAILTFAQTERLTGAAVGRLLSLIDLHCPSKNNLVKSTVKLFDHLDYLNSDFELSFYCNLCWRARVSSQDLCDKCKDPKRKVHFFVHFSLAEQLKSLYKRPQFIEALKYRQTRSKIDENAIEDIIDGALYQEALKGFLSDPNNLSMMWYTDGIQLFESTSFSVWPQFFVLLELPPDQRFKPENMLLAGLWGSRDHPHPNIVLRHIVNDLLDLREKGVEVVLPDSNETRVVKVCCLCGTCDSPAKAAFMNLKGHAGYYSCPVCFNKGLKSEASGNVMVFPYEKEGIIRSSHEGYPDFVTNSLKHYKNTTLKDEACKGIQGPTLLSFMFYLCMFKSLAVDSMHCIYMGLVKQLCHLWFDSTLSKAPFSLRDKLGEVDKLLFNIQLPQFVQRLPVSVDKLSFWKASLCLNFFFHMMLPVLKTVMKQDYFEHLSLLVDSVALLNSSSVTLADIERADSMLCKFVEDFPKYYQLRNMSLNVHLSRHLATAVKNLGPLWSTSCFPFEDFNGKLINLSHGTSDSLLQISRRFPILTGLSTEIEKLPPGSAREFCEQLVKKWKRYHIKDKLSDQTFVVGFYDNTVMYSTELSKILLEKLQYLPVFHTYPKMYHDKQLYVASTYTRSVRKSSAVKYVTDAGTKYGDILTFVKVGKSDYFAYIQSLKTVPFNEACPAQVSYLCKIVDVSGYDLVPIKSLKSVCFYVSVEGTNYISNVLNAFERF